MELGLSLALTRRRRAVSGQGGGSAPTAPVLAAPGTFDAQAIVGEQLLWSPPTFTGADTVAYQWYRGDPGAGGTVISGATTLGYQPVDVDLGFVLFCRVTATNAQGATVADVGSGFTVGATFIETWEGQSIGAGTAVLIDTGGDWAGSELVATELVATPFSPTGRALQVWAGTSTVQTIYHKPPNAALVAATGGIEFTETLYVIVAKDFGNRTMYRQRDTAGLGGQVGAGFSIRIGSMFHQLPGDDPTDPAGEGLGLLTADTVYAVRHQIEGDTSRIKLWEIDQPEPAEWVSERIHTSPLVDMGPTIGIRHDQTDTHRNEVQMVSFGINTPARADPRFSLIAPVSNDPYSAAAPVQTNSVSVMDNLITFNLEDM